MLVFKLKLKHVDGGVSPVITKPASDTTYQLTAQNHPLLPSPPPWPGDCLGRGLF